MESRAPLTALGLLFFAVGMFYLFNPAAPTDPETAVGSLAAALPMRVANLQRLAIGQTFSIVGAIFCAVAWRPR